MKSILTPLLIATVLALPLSAYAEEPATPAPAARDTPAPEPETTVVYAARTLVDFSAMTISGEVERPAGSYMVVTRKARFRTLIRVRGGFLPEIARSADHL